jgi:formate/nitrite transporter FocA (FNT family)
VKQQPGLAGSWHVSRAARCVLCALCSFGACKYAAKSTPPACLFCAGTFLGRNLVPATLGNLIGGCLFVGAAYACSFGTPAHAGEPRQAGLVCS